MLNVERVEAARTCSSWGEGRWGEGRRVEVLDHGGTLIHCLNSHDASIMLLLHLDKSHCLVRYLPKVISFWCVVGMFERGT